MEETKRRLYVERDGFFTEASMLFMALAIVFRLIGSLGRWSELQYMVTQVALPVFSGLLFVVFLLAFSRRAFWTTVIPVVIGVVFFIFRIMEVENEWQKVGCISLYVVIAVFYAMAFSHKSLKWVLAAILGAAFLYHVVILDVPVLMNLEKPVLFVDGMQELSVLAIMLSLLCVSLAMKMPAKPAKPAEPAAPEKPAEPGKSAEPAKPAQPAPAPEEPQAAPQEPPIVLADPQPTVLVEEIPVPQSPAGEHGTENP